MIERIVRRGTRYARRVGRAYRLGRMRLRTSVQLAGEIRAGGFRLRILDPSNAYVMFKDIFENEIYRFDAASPAPRIVDCGSNIGMSVAYFKHLYPDARIVAFEADHEVFGTLAANIRENGMTDVELVEAAVATEDGTASFARAHDYDGSLAQYHQSSSGKTAEVRTVSLRSWLKTDVDLVKLNIEGAEHDVLTDISDLLGNVKCLVVEYHHEPGLPRTLDAILRLLSDAGFEYVIHDFDARTNAGSHPPFRLNRDSRYYLLVYAARPEA